MKRVMGGRLMAAVVVLLVLGLLGTGGITRAQGGPQIPPQSRPATPPAVGTIPKKIDIAKAAVDAQVEQALIVKGVMQDPSGPWVVAWYKETAKLGQVGNVVLAGHVDYWNVGPSVFYRVEQLQKGDEIDVTGADGKVYKYQVQWNKLIEVKNAPLQQLVGPTTNQSLTLITCGGTFDYSTGEYLQRSIVRATRIDA